MNKIIFILHLFIFCNITAQSNFSNKDILLSYENYFEMPREQVYVHLNKSIFIKGEAIGLKAYILNKTDKKLSTNTTNLYCLISDAQNKIIKKKLIMVTNGVANSDFKIDSLFTSGEYTIRAYTNWMKNFKEQNFFIQKIQIIDPTIENEKKPPLLLKTNGINAQFLPEGGHLISDVNNTVGVVIKDNLGFGLPFLKGVIVDNKNNIINTFKTNHVGIAKFTFTPNDNDKYFAQLNYNENTYKFSIKNIEATGIAMSLFDLKNKIAIKFKTNKVTLQNIRDKNYKLVIHNGNSLKKLPIKFQNKIDLLKVIPYKDLFTGINIFTLFDNENNPLLERLFFNYEGLTFAKSQKSVIKKTNDSILISIPFEEINTTVLNNFSVSILPVKTKTYHHHHNLPSYIFLQPYVKGYIENAEYYFSEINSKKKYALDNLLLTQGWSSYSWDSIFEKPPIHNYDFENGISFIANASNSKNKQLLLYPNINSPSEIIDIGKHKNSFERVGFFLIDDESIKIGEIDSKGNVGKANLSLQFSPLKIPILNFKMHILNTKMYNVHSELNNNQLTWQNSELLNEVIVTGKRKYTRLENLQNTTLGKIEIFDQKMKRNFRTIAKYLRSKGYVVIENPGHSYNTFLIFSPGTATFRGQFSPSNVPLIYLDGTTLNPINLSILKDMTLDQIDYIEINKSGIGGGIRGGGGIIKIFTNPFKTTDKIDIEELYSEYIAPLTFSVSKKFYIPNYKSYSSDFFNEYGVIGWFPNVNIDKKGQLDIKIYNNQTSEVKLFIEGIINDSTYVSEIKKIKLN
jgi:hypothetical protein